MEIEVEVWCNKCDKAMKGSEEMFHSPQNHSQAREYTCDTCDTVVGVGLYPKVEPRVPRVKVQ